MPGLSGVWEEELKEEFGKEYYQKLYTYVKNEYQTHTVYPPAKDLLNAFHFTPFDKIKVVILGQDPYHNPEEAHGLCFSVRPGVKIPPSLVNIYKEMEEDLGIKPASHGCLTSWARQGVLLLNTVLTVRAHEPMSHRNIGWETFTDQVIRKVNTINRPIVFILWGGPARKKKALLDHPNHLILESAHPSPLSAYRGFFGSKPFSKTNEFLVSHGETPINWEIPDGEDVGGTT